MFTVSKALLVSRATLTLSIRNCSNDSACTWWNRPEEDNSSGKLESTHPSRTSVKSDQVFFGVESVMRVNADSLLIRAAATSTSGTLNDLTTDLIMANNNNNIRNCFKGLDGILICYFKLCVGYVVIIFLLF